MFDERAMPGESTWAELSGPHLARYHFAVEFARGRRVLDAGCGGAYGTALLAAGGAGRVVGIDLEAEAVGRARQRFGAPGIEFLVDDCQQLAGAGGPFDLVCSFENIEHLPEPERFLEAAGRVLAPDGLLLVSTPDRAVTPPFVGGRPRNPFHLHEWYRDEFAAMLGRWFDAVEMRVQVESHAVVRRSAALRALRRLLMWTNPLSAFAWRKLSRDSQGRRSWRALEGLADGGPGDYPIVPLGLAEVFGRPWCHVALCRNPRRQQATVPWSA